MNELEKLTARNTQKMIALAKDGAHIDPLTKMQIQMNILVATLFPEPEQLHEIEMAYQVKFAEILDEAMKQMRERKLSVPNKKFILP